MEEFNIDKVYTKDDIKMINMDDEFKEVTKDDEDGQYLYIISKNNFTLPDLFIKKSILPGPLNSGHKIEELSND